MCGTARVRKGQLYAHGAPTKWNFVILKRFTEERDAASLHKDMTRRSAGQLRGDSRYLWMVSAQAGFCLSHSSYEAIGEVTLSPA